MSEIKVLSTKKLSATQQELFHNVNISLKEYNAILTEELPFKSVGEIENAIVTSQTTARILIRSKASIKKVFCVGEKTASMMTKSGYKVVEISKKASVLAEFIVKKHKNDSFLFFCGKRRRDELPKVLLENKINFTEEILYQTNLNSQEFKENFDGVLFFSPSGVESYMQENSLENSIAFCIGETTAAVIKEEAIRIIISDKSSIESVFSKLKEYYSL